MSHNSYEIQFSVYVKSAANLRNCASNKMVCINQTHLLTDKYHLIEFGKHSGMVNTKFILHFAVIRCYIWFVILGRQPPSGPWPPPHSRGFLWFLDHTQRHTTVGRTPLDELSTRRRDLYLTTNNTHNRQTSIPPAGFEPTI
jgi:hypothetical protein